MRQISSNKTPLVSSQVVTVSDKEVAESNILALIQPRITT